MSRCKRERCMNARNDVTGVSKCYLKFLASSHPSELEVQQIVQTNKRRIKDFGILCIARQYRRRWSLPSYTFASRYAPAPSRSQSRRPNERGRRKPFCVSAQVRPFPAVDRPFFLIAPHRAGPRR